MIGLDIIISAILCVLISVGIFFVARYSLSQTEVVVPNENVKPKTKPVKKSSKIKVAKKETDKPINIFEPAEERQIPSLTKTGKKDKNSNRDVTTPIASTSVDKPTTDNVVEWKKVIKQTKKINKKENKTDIVEDAVIESVEPERVSADMTELANFVAKSEKSKKSKKAAKLKIDSNNLLKGEPEKQPEIFVKESKEKAEEIKQQNDNEEMDLRRRIGELMSELDRLKSSKKEENKTFMQTIGQLNKELETMKQKMKVCQSSEEKLNEELKKKNLTFADLKQQFVIVQSELTKNIIQVQSLGREKDKLESRVISLEGTNKQLTEKGEKFERANSERETLIHKLTTVEDECRVNNTRFNEVLKTKELESNEKIHQLQSDKQRMQDQLVRVQTDLLENNSKLQNIQQELLNTKNTYTDLLSENIRLQNNCAQFENKKQQHQLFEATKIAREREYSERIDEMAREIDNLKSSNDEIVSENITLKKQFQELISNHSEDDVLHEKLASLTLELNQVNQLMTQTKLEADNHQLTSNNLRVEINNLEKEKINLLSSVEHSKTELENRDTAISKLNMQLHEDDDKLRERLRQSQLEAEQHLASLTDELNSVKDALSLATAESGISNASSDKLMAEINDLKAEKENLIAMVDQYKNGLENTESILSKLQMSVNEEEAKWRETLLKSEKEAEKCSNELEKVYNDLIRIKNKRSENNDINFAYHCVDESISSLIDEIEAQMTHFAVMLESVLQERDNALSQMHMKMNGTTYADNVHGDNVEEDISDREIMKIKEDLASQVERNKNMEIRCNKYQSLVDIGKDALTAEEAKVRTLEEELKLLQGRISTGIDEHV